MQHLHCIHRSSSVDNTNNFISVPVCSRQQIACELKQKVKKGKPRRNDCETNHIVSRTKHRALVPNNMKEAIQLDDCNGDTLWAVAIAKEMNGLNVLKWFQCHHCNWCPPADFQHALL